MIICLLIFPPKPRHKLLTIIAIIIDIKRFVSAGILAAWVQRAARARGTCSSICRHCGFIAAERIQDMTPSGLSLLPRPHYHNEIHLRDSN